MAITPHTLVLLDGANHAVLIVDGPRGEILAEIALPPGLSPTNLVLCGSAGKTYIPLAGNSGKGALYVLDIAARLLSLVADDLPHPAQACASADGTRLVLVDPGGGIHSFDTQTRKLSSWGSPGSSACCVGLATDVETVFSAWETPAGGVLAVFNLAGQWLDEFAFTGTPTHLTLDSLGRVLIPFTANTHSGEGVLIFHWQQKDGSPAVIQTQCSQCAAVHRRYPCHVAVTADGRTAYIVNEDSATITIADLNTFQVTGNITVGKSVTQLALLADEKFGVASSNMFADLCIIDLVNQRPVAFSANSREILSPLAVIYQDNAGNNK